MQTLVIGKLRRPHGIHGAIKVESYSGEAEHFRSLTEATLVSGNKTRSVRIVSATVHNCVPVLTFEGVETPEAARHLTGWEVRVPRADAAALGVDEYYSDDLVGVTVYVDEAVWGRVVAVIDGSQAPLLEIERVDPQSTAESTEARVTGNQRILVPFMERFVNTAGIEAGRLEITERWILDSE